MERKTYTRYSREFKLEAVRLAAIGERPKAQIARELGIRVNQLRKWRLEFEREELTGAPLKRGHPVDDDLGRLRRENAKLKEENEILKKAAIYFARESK
ncbi:MAG: transposase [Burkholderiales bacterium]